MKTVVWLALLLIGTAVAHAQNIKVLKVQGRKAIVQFPAGTELRAGQMLSAEDELAFDDGKSRSSQGSRLHTIGGNAAFSSTTTKFSPSGNQTTTSSLSMSARFGWNDGKMEYGPIAGLSKTSGGTVDVTGWEVGGFFDYNFIPNFAGKDMVYGAGGWATFGGTSGGGASTNATSFFGGGFLKWFSFGNSVAIRTDAGMRYAKAGTGSTSSTATSFLVSAGLQVYY